MQLFEDVVRKRYSRQLYPHWMNCEWLATVHNGTTVAAIPEVRLSAMLLLWTL
jgi:hypothetical protein